MKFAFYREQKHPYSHLDRFPFSNDGELFLYSYTIDRDLLNRLRSLLSANTSLFSHPGRGLQESFSLLLDKVNASLRLPDFREHLHGKEHFMIMVTRSTELHFSLLGQLTVGYVESGVLTQLSDGMTTAGYDFGYISSGLIEDRSLLLVSHRSISTRFVKDDLIALMESDSEDDLHQNLEYIWREHQIGEGGVAVFVMDPIPSAHISGESGAKAHFQGSFAKKIFAYVGVRGAQITQVSTAFWDRLYRYFSFDRKRKIALFASGVLFSCILLFVLLSSILRIASTPLTQDRAASLLFEIRSHVEEASKNSVNREVFAKEIQDARALLGELEKTGYYIQDRLNLLHDIEVLQKQVNGIIAVAPREDQKLYSFETPSQDKKKWIFDLKQGFVVVEPDRIIDTVAKQNAEPQKVPLPAGEEVIDGALGDAGVVYMLTSARKIFRYSQGVLKQVGVESTIPGVAPQWADGSKIVFYNSNVYILGTDGSSVFRHRPIVSGYSARYDNILSGLPAPQPIMDFSIDRDVYVLRTNGSAERIVTGSTPSRNVLTLKNLPNDMLPVAFDTKNASIIHMSTTRNIFILSSGSAMVFRPNTLTTNRQSELNYLGTIDIPNEQIRSLYPVSDTVVLIATDVGVYRMEFQITEDKILPI